MDGLLAQCLTDVLELPVDITVHLQHFLVVVRVGLEQRDLAVLRGQFLFPVEIVARDRHVFAARCARRHCSCSRVCSPAAKAAAQQIAQQSEPDTCRANDSSGQGRVGLAVACVFHKKSSGKSSKLASSYSHSAASPVFMGDISGTFVYHLWDMLSS